MNNLKGEKKREKRGGRRVGAGRKPKPKENLKEQRITLRLSIKQMKIFEMVAEETGKTVSEVLRELAYEQAKLLTGLQETEDALQNTPPTSDVPS